MIYTAKEASKEAKKKAKARMRVELYELMEDIEDAAKNGRHFTAVEHLTPECKGALEALGFKIMSCEHNDFTVYKIYFEGGVEKTGAKAALEEEFNFDDYDYLP